MTEEPIRVLIADDHGPVRAGVRRALERGGMVVCAECGDGREAVEQAVEQRPDVCLLDVNMPGGGTAAAAEITARLPATTILMLTVSDDEGDLVAALEAGAAGYLLKGIDPERLPFAVRSALDGDAIIPRALASRALRPFREGVPRRRTLMRSVEDKLSARERDVLLLMRDGRSTADIAGELRIAEVTVRRHVSEILRKLEVSDRASAVRLIDEGVEPGGVQE